MYTAATWHQAAPRHRHRRHDTAVAWCCSHRDWTGRHGRSHCLWWSETWGMGARLGGRDMETGRNPRKRRTASTYHGVLVGFYCSILLGVSCHDLMPKSEEKILTHSTVQSPQVCSSANKFHPVASSWYVAHWGCTYVFMFIFLSTLNPLWFACTHILERVRLFKGKHKGTDHWKYQHVWTYFETIKHINIVKIYWTHLKSKKNWLGIIRICCIIWWS